jgi:hypothetical protein
VGWILLSYKLAPEPPRARVAVWREIRRSGALHLQQSLVAFPDSEDFMPAVERFRALVEEVGGEALTLRGEGLVDGDGERLIEAWNEARDAEYGELVGKCESFLEEIEHEFAIEKFTLAELEEEEAEVEKLERWHARIEARDVHDAERGADARGARERAQAALARYADAVYERTQP